MASIIATVQNDFPQFWGLPLSMDGVELRKTEFDAVNALLLLDLLQTEGRAEGLVLVLPGDAATKSIVIIEALLALFYCDYCLSEKDYFKNLKEDDPIILFENGEKKKGIYIGVRPDANGNPLYYVKVKDGRKDLLRGLPESSKWKIKPLPSASEKGSSRSGVAATGKALEDAFALHPGDITAVQKSRLLCVTNQKSSLQEMLRSMRVGDDPFEEVFPMSSYSSGERRYGVGRNPFDIEPILSFAPAADIAADLATSDPSHRLILLDGRSKIRSAYGSLDRVKSIKNRPSILCLLGPEDEDELNALCERGMECWCWDAGDFKKLSPPEAGMAAGEMHPFARRDGWMRRLSERESTVREIPYPQGVGDLVGKIQEDLKALSRELSITPEGGMMAACCWRMFKDFLQLPLPASEYNLLLQQAGMPHAQLDTRLVALHEKLMLAIGREVPTQLADKVKGLLSDYDKFYAAIEGDNPKMHALSEEISNTGNAEGAWIVTGTKEQAIALSSWDALPRGITVADHSCYPEDPCDRTVMTGWMNAAFAAGTRLSPVRVISHLLYPCERQSLETAESRRLKTSYAVADEMLRGRMFGGQFGRATRQEETPAGMENDADSLLDEIVRKLHETGTGGMQAGPDTRDAHIVAFDDGSFAYLTRDSRVDRIDRNSGDIESCTVADIAPRDELVFTDGSRKLFTEIIAGIEASPKFRIMADKAALWWKALKGYSDEHELDAHDIAEMLSARGCSRTPSTVAAWMEGDRIGPSEYGVIDAIAEITGDGTLSQNIDAVKESCHAIFALHMKAGRMLIRRIINAAARNERDGMDEDVRKEIEDYARNARILTVHSVSSSAVPVAAGLVGTLSTSG